MLSLRVLIGRKNSGKSVTGLDLETIGTHESWEQFSVLKESIISNL